MSLLVPYNGQNYILPTTGEVGWGSNLDAYLVAISAGSLQKSGGSFTLSAEVDFGASFGLKSLYYKSRSSNVASTGVLRGASTEALVAWRNNANSGDLALTTDSSDRLLYNGIIIGGSGLYTANRAIISDGSGNLSAATTTSTEIGYVNGVTSSIQTQLNAKEPTITVLPISKGGTNSGTALNNNRFIVSSGSAIVEAAAVTASRALASDSNGLPVASVTTAAELAFVNGVTSAIQTQLNTKVDTAGTALSKTGTTLNVTTVPVANGGTNAASFTAYSVICAGTTSTGTFQNVSGVGSSGQVLTSNGAAALPTWQNVAGSGTVNSGTQFQLAYYATSTNAVSGLALITAARALVSDANGLPTASTVTTTELGYVSGVTSAIQTQLNLKAPLASPTFTGTVTIPDGVAVTTAASIGQVNNAFAMDNVLINGNFTFWQRQTSTSLSVTSGVYSGVDRWNYRYANFATTDVTISQNTGNLDGTGTYVASVAPSNIVGTSRIYLQQKVENYQDYTGKTVTLTVRIKTTSSNIICQIDDGVGTTNSSAHSGGGAYETLTLTRTLSASATQLFINIGAINAAPTQVFYIATAMLVLGSISVPYSSRPYAQELALCQRYYEKSYAVNTVPGTNTAVGRVRGCGSQFGTTSVRSCFYAFKVVKQNDSVTMGIYPSDGTTQGQWVWTSTSGSDSDRTTSVDPRANGFSVSQTAALDFVNAGQFTAEAEI